MNDTQPGAVPRRALSPGALSETLGHSSQVTCGRCTPCIMVLLASVDERDYAIS